MPVRLESWAKQAFNQFLSLQWVYLSSVFPEMSHTIYPCVMSCCLIKKLTILALRTKARRGTWTVIPEGMWISHLAMNVSGVFTFQLCTLLSKQHSWIARCQINLLDDECQIQSQDFLPSFSPFKQSWEIVCKW